MHVRESLLVRLFSLKIPVLLFLGPRIVGVDDEGCAIEIPLRWRSKNHLGSMYFGALCVGADCAAGVLAMQLIRRQPERISMVFKDFHAEFLKRAEGDVDFCCRQGKEIAELVAEAATSEERVERQIEVIATVPSLNDAPVARFRLTLSLKRRTAAK